MRIGVGAIVMAGALLALDLGAAYAAQPPPKRATVNAVYQVPLYKSTIVPMDRAPTRVSIGNPGVADILVIKNRELYIVGKALGSTNVVIWDDSGRNTNFDIEVTHDLDTLKAKLYELMPNEDISVSSAGDQLVLSGQVTSAAHVSAAMQVASSFLPTCIAATSDAPVRPVTGSRGGGGGGGDCKKGTVLNMLQVSGSQQVMLKVTVAELDHSVVRRLESHLSLMQFGASHGHVAAGAVAGGATFPPAVTSATTISSAGGTITTTGGVTPVFGGGSGLNPIGPFETVLQPNLPTITSTGLFLGYLQSNTFLQAVLDVSKSNGLAKILSEPTLTTTTGQEASFLSGGEFPIPVPQGGIGGGITVTFKEFGVKLKFTPTVLDSNRINMALNVSVSEISNDNAVAVGGGGTASTFAIPALTTRSAQSNVELGDGQTMGIAGLINDNTRELVSKFPLLGDIPILGALFRSENYRADKSELVIFVTPHLAEPIRREHYRLPTDTFVEPNDVEFYLMGTMGREKDRPQQSNVDWATQSGPAQQPPSGSYGHDLGTTQPPAPKEKTP